MKTLFVNPPPVNGAKFIREGRCMQSVDSWAAIWPPLSLATMAAIGRNHGEVSIFDGNVEENADLQTTAAFAMSFQPDLVVVNTAFPSIRSDNACAEAIKKCCPDSLIAGYGPFFTLLEKGAMLECPAFDIGMIGEPEKTFERIQNCLISSSSIGDVKGIMYRKDNRIVQTPNRKLIQDLDALPFPARDLLKNDSYILPNNGHTFTLVNVGRGCPHACIYCIAPSYYGKKIRKHSVDYIMREIEECREKFGINDFLFWEEVFTFDKEYTNQICEEIVRRKLNISWAATTRADRVDRELLKTMKNAGCMLLGLGIESAHQEILDTAKKQERVEDIIKTVSLCKEVGLQSMGHFIFGLPGETEKTIRETIKFATRIGLDYIQCYPAVPYPKTKLYELAKASGWITSTNWADYNFGGSSILNIGSVSPAKVDQARQDLFKAFYFRPLYVLKQVLSLIKHPRQLLQASKFLKWMIK